MSRPHGAFLPLSLVTGYCDTNPTRIGRPSLSSIASGSLSGFWWYSAPPDRQENTRSRIAMALRDVLVELGRDNRHLPQGVEKLGRLIRNNTLQPSVSPDKRSLQFAK